MSARPFLGSPVRRVEDAALLTGRAEFVDDLDAVGMLHVAFLRSPFAHARLTRVDVSAARAHETPGLNHRLEVVGGVLDDECRAMMQDFFKARR